MNGFDYIIVAGISWLAGSFAGGWAAVRAMKAFQQGFMARLDEFDAREHDAP